MSLNEKRIFTNTPVWTTLPEIRRDEKWVWFRKSASSTIQTALSNVEAWEAKK